uniref:Kisspeptin 2 n=1 Tax=Oryzias sinensis TaxID=183150 RepID=A0A8C8E368_9TELE
CFLVFLIPACCLSEHQSGKVSASSSGVLWILRRSEDDSAAGGAGLCSSLREDDEQLLCADRRSKFNYNPFGLRFGKRPEIRYELKLFISNTYFLFILFSPRYSHWTSREGLRLFLQFTSACPPPTV